MALKHRVSSNTQLQRAMLRACDMQRLRYFLTHAAAGPSVYKPASLFLRQLRDVDVSVWCAQCCYCRYYTDGAESCSVLSGSVVARGHVSVLKSFNNVRNSYTRAVNRKSGFTFLGENWKVNNRKSSVRCFTRTHKSDKNAAVVFHMMEMGGN
jgi:hypothetical protein